jgi:hypothetical protein
MFKKKIIKYSAISILITALVLTGLIAVTQNGFFAGFGNDKKEKKEKIETGKEEAEDIGVPTDDDPWNEMDQLVKAYYNTDGVSYTGIIKLIDDNGDKEKIIEQHSFEYTQYKSSYYYRLASMEFVNKENMLVAVDTVNKTIAISPVLVQKEKSKAPLFGIEEFKKIMEEQKADAKVTQLGNQKILTIDNIQDPSIQGYRIYYSPSTYRISKMLIGMLRLSPLDDGDESVIVENTENNKKEVSADDDNTKESANEDEPEIDTYTYYMEIIYTDTKSLSLQGKDFAPESKFFKMNKGQIELMPAYKDYELLNGGVTAPAKQKEKDAE